MGKASRRKHQDVPKGPTPAAFVARPFAGLPGETDWVALKEILPAATITVPLAEGVAPDGPGSVTVTTVLPMAWPAIHRADGALLIATQGGGGSGDASRDLGSALLAALAVAPGTPLPHVPLATSETPPLADLIDTTATPEVVVHDGFDYWVEGQDLDSEARRSLEQANAAVVPTEKVDGVDSAYWCLLAGRPHVRVVLPQDEDAATDALARVYAASSCSLGDGTRLLGAFRACGLLVPVWELAGTTSAAEVAGPLAQFMHAYAAALTEAPLSPEERRAKSGLLSRQVTLR